MDHHKVHVQRLADGRYETRILPVDEGTGGTDLRQEHDTFSEVVVYARWHDLEIVMERNVHDEIARQAAEFRRSWSVPSLERLSEVLSAAYQEGGDWPEEMKTLKSAVLTALKER